MASGRGGKTLDHVVEYRFRHGKKEFKETLVQWKVGIPASIKQQWLIGGKEGPFGNAFGFRTFTRKEEGLPQTTSVWRIRMLFRKRFSIGFSDPMENQHPFFPSGKIF